MDELKWGDITICSKANKSFFCINDDKTEYYDLDNLVINHPEQTEFVDKHKFGLERALMRKKETSV